MKFRFGFVLCVFCATMFATGLTIGQRIGIPSGGSAANVPVIKVRVVSGRGSVGVGPLTGMSLLADGQRLEGAQFGPVQVSYSGGGWRYRDATGNSGVARTLEVRRVGGGAADGLVIDGKRYRGGAIFVGRGNGVTILNEITIEDWLCGVTGAEIGDEAPLEALKAQAIAARSEAMFKLRRPPHANEGFDFCNGVHCQAYKGTSEESAATRDAVFGTMGQVLVAEGGVIDAVYSNVCGGVSAGSEDVWNSKPMPGLVRVFDGPGRAPFSDLSDEGQVRSFLDGGDAAFCNPDGKPTYARYAQKYFRWQKRMTAAEIGRATGVGALRDIRVTERTPSGRVRKLTISGSAGQRTIEKELPIRNALDLWSGLFVMDIERAGGGISGVTFVGAGNGHGVGLCQHGTRMMATAGYQSGQIVGHYYRGATLQKAY